MMRGVRFLVVLVGLLAPVAAGADEFEDADAAYRRGDYVDALKVYRELAERGHAEAQLALGTVYETGEGAPQNYAEAVKLYRRAAEQGHAGAQNNLGLMYYIGRGVPQDYVQAHKWYNLAASRSPESTREFPAMNRDIVAAKMTREQIAEAQRLAREWKPKPER